MRKNNLYRRVLITNNTPTTELTEHTEYHKDGSIRAKGQKLNGELFGYWEWFRKDGSKMRSGHFNKGKEVGEWITYDQQGKIYKVTNKQ